MKPYVILLLILLTSCETFFKNKNERVLARVQNEYLYESDIKGIVTPGTTGKDSLVVVSSFIQNWVQQQLIIQQAKKNLSDAQMDFTKQLEDYKNSLLIYEYENALVRQKLDTLVTDEEIELYYDANQQNFQLKDNIVKMQYVKLPVKSGQVKQFKKLMGSGDPDDQNKLAELCEKQSLDYFLDDQNWLLFNDVLKQIPIVTYNQEDFLKNNKYLEYQDSLFIYLVLFKDFKIKESLSPMSFERQRIIDIILNKRKMDLITRMQQDIYINAQKKNDFEIY